MSRSRFSTHPYVHQINVSNGGVPKHPVPEARITVEVIEALHAEGHSIAPGSSGENLTLAGLDWARLKPGDRLGIGETVRLEMVSYTAPCQNNAAWFKDGNFTRISHKRYPGWSRLYAR